jgi:CRP-like cAMP-binding protein
LTSIKAGLLRRCAQLLHARLQRVTPAMGLALVDHDSGLSTIQALPTFGERSKADLRPLARAARPLELGTRRPVYHQGEACTAVYVLAEGGVKLERREGSGPAQVVGILEPPAMFGETGLRTSMGYLVSAVTFRPSRLLAIDADVFAEWLRQRPALYECVLAELSRNLEALISTAYARATLSAEQRVASYLLHRCRDSQVGEVVVDRALSRRDIANLLGLAPETLSRVLHGFRERHWISVSEGCIAIRSNHGLASLLP